MPPAITAEKITLNYPVFAADFLDADNLVVAGGGGEGNSGVGNKIVGFPTVILAIARELTSKLARPSLMSPSPARPQKQSTLALS